MKAVRVQYKVRPEYTDTNKKNIAGVMNELKKANEDGIKYSVFISEDDVTFMHLAVFRDETEQKKLNEMESFKKFASELQASIPVEPPKPETLFLEGSNHFIIW